MKVKTITMNEEHEKLIDSVVRHSFTVITWQLVELYTRGLTPSSIYKIEVEGTFYIAKISDPTHPFNNLPREYNSMLVAAKNNVGPKVYYQNAELGIAIIAFVESTPIPLTEFSNEKTTSGFANFIKQLHHCDHFCDSQLIYIRNRKIIDMLPDDVKSMELVQSAIAIARQAEFMLSDPEDLRPSHADINPYNLLFNSDQFKLVDWATAAQESLYFDVAVCATFFYFANLDAEDRFLRHYFERHLTENEKEKYKLMKSFVAAYYGVGFLFHACQRNTNVLPECKIDTQPSYPDYMKMIGEGKADLSLAKDQQRMGLVLLRRMININGDI